MLLAGMVSYVPIIVALVATIGSIAVAVIAINRERRSLSTQRHFEFADRKSDAYSEFIRASGETWAAYWETLQAKSVPQALKARLKCAKELALKLDVRMDVLRVTAPERTVSATAQVNGMIQTYVTSLEMGFEPPFTSEEFEEAKRQMHDAMRSDIALAELSRDRDEYSRKVRKAR